jgi:succinoglycan biosynthesis transport protein ExoP
VLLGAAIGLVFGIGIVFVGDYVSDRPKSAGELAELLNAPVLGYIAWPARRAGSTVLPPEDVSPRAESYRIMAAALERVSKGQLRTLVLTSLGAEKATSLIAADLAAILAERGHDVILVAAGSDRSVAEGLIAASGEQDPQTAPLGEEAPGWTLSVTTRPRLQVVMRTQHLAGAPAATLAWLIRTPRNQARWTILDTAPLLECADASTLAPMADGVLLVVDCPETSRDRLERAAALLSNIDANVVGVVACDPPDA